MNFDLITGLGRSPHPLVQVPKNSINSELVSFRTEKVFCKKSILQHIYYNDFGISKVSILLMLGGYIMKAIILAGGREKILASFNLKA